MVKRIMLYGKIRDEQEEFPKTEIVNKTQISTDT